MNWAAQEFEMVELGDKRLNNWLVKLVQQLAANPTASIPAACGGWDDTAAAYRLLDDERCDWREISWLASGAVSARHDRVGLGDQWNSKPLT